MFCANIAKYEEVNHTIMTNGIHAWALVGDPEPYRSSFFRVFIEAR